MSPGLRDEVVCLAGGHLHSSELRSTVGTCPRGIQRPVRVAYVVHPGIGELVLDNFVYLIISSQGDCKDCRILPSPQHASMAFRAHTCQAIHRSPFTCSGSNGMWSCLQQQTMLCTIPDWSWQDQQVIGGEAASLQERLRPF